MRYLIACLFVLAPLSVSTQEKPTDDLRSVEIQKGEEAPFDGVLLPMNDAEFLFAATERMQNEIKIYENLFPDMQDTLQMSIETIEARNKTQREMHEGPSKGALFKSALQGSVLGFSIGSATTLVLVLLLK